MKVSCLLATEPATAGHIELAERLGYARAYCFDTPALCADPWMTLARAADRTQQIGLATGVIVPRLRHPMTTASAIATLAALAPGRVVLGVGSGFTGAMLLGQRPMGWGQVERYLVALVALLRGEEVEWDGALLRMCHPEGFAPRRPIQVPLLLAADGPYGQGVARRLGAGIWAHAAPEGFAWVACTIHGTVLEPGESPTSARAFAAAAPAAAVRYHRAYEAGGDRLDQLPGGPQFRALVDGVAEERRHLALHEGHLVHLNELDRQVLSPEFAAEATATGPPELIRERLDRLAAEGFTEVMYQPKGDVPRELKAFAAVAIPHEAARA
ncbi:MAG: LLM class flavin-dependent oxidoreductase [Candidatus Dormibacteraeota bacterium]|nr:LLM class flavin-dependent oxidoreductase [Candidatus Dormibacteraeota bacterium]